MCHFDQAPSVFLANPERRTRVAIALSLLRDAWDAASDVTCSPWHFAVKREEFRAAGIADTYLLWLLIRGYVAHDQGPQGVSALRAGRGLNVGWLSRFVLTREGIAFAAEWLDMMPAKPVPVEAAQRGQPESSLRPQWDSELRQLYWGGILVKHFRVPAHNQELILEAFEEEGWPRHIDDPLPQAHGIDPKVRLRYALKGLNRNQVNNVLLFEGDGRARGIVWQRLQCASLSYPNRTGTFP
jgi:hypothetical protein